MDFMTILTAFIGSTISSWTPDLENNPIPVTTVWFGTIRHKKKKCSTTWTATYTFNPWTKDIKIHYNGKKYSPSGFAIAHYIAEQPLRTAAANGWVECEVFAGNKWMPADFLRQISPQHEKVEQPQTPEPEVEIPENINLEAELAEASIEDTESPLARTPLVDYDSEDDEESEAEPQVEHEHEHERQKWMGPVPSNYIKGNYRNAEGKLRFYKTIEEAMSEAEKLGDACGGITETRKGFTLRTGTELKYDSRDVTTNPKHYPKNSWLKIN